MTIQFAMNRTCAPQLRLEEFIKLTTNVGVGAVEIRNDVPEREFMDGSKAEDILAKLNEAKLKVASVNALQRFNEWTKERETEAKSLLSFAARLGAPGVVLCPVHNPDHGWSIPDAERNLRNGLKQLRPILKGIGIMGYVEPLGMMGSTMKFQSMAVEAIEDVDGWDAYQLCYDTFQFFRCRDAVVYPERIGLIHMSGIVRPDLLPQEQTEPDRVLVEAVDCVENIKQLKALLSAGYVGYVSMEPFNPLVQNSTTLCEELQNSFARVNSGLLSDTVCRFD